MADPTNRDESLLGGVLGKRDAKLREVSPLPTTSLAQIGLRARRVAEGLLAGQHQSNRFGQNIEFADYREYVPGDDLRHIDWRAYGRSDRLFIKRFEAETAMRSTILLDVSRSMLYGEGPEQKFQYGAEMAATLATLAVLQRDVVGLALYDEELCYWQAPSSSPEELRRMIQALSEVPLKKNTATGPVLKFLSHRLKRRGFLILISDFWDDPAECLRGLQHFAGRGFDIMVVQLLTREEMDFPFLGTLEIESLEDQPLLETDARAIRKAYQRRLEEHQGLIKDGCTRYGIHFEAVVTDEPLQRSLWRILSFRRRSPV